MLHIVAATVSLGRVRQRVSMEVWVGSKPFGTRRAVAVVDRHRPPGPAAPVQSAASGWSWPWLMAKAAASTGMPT